MKSEPKHLGSIFKIEPARYIMNIAKNREIGGRIKAVREDMGIFMTKLGDWIGVGYQQIQKYENGISTLSVDKLDKIATCSWRFYLLFL